MIKDMIKVRKGLNFYENEEFKDSILEYFTIYLLYLNKQAKIVKLGVKK